MYVYRNSVRLLYFVHWVGHYELWISEWKCIPEWKFRMEVHSRMEIQNGKCIPEWNIYVELNGPYGLP